MHAERSPVSGRGSLPKLEPKGRKALTPDALAKSAREKLALALNALQTSPDTPVDLLDLAEPIAQTMGILHRIERSQGKDLSGRDQVLANIRSALNSLQTMTESHPAIDAVMEQVAGCLASAHQLARYESAPDARAPAPAPAAPQAPPAGLAPVVPTAPGGVASIAANIPPPRPTPQPVVHAANPFTQPAEVVPAAPHVPNAPIVPLGGTVAMPPVANMQQTMPLPPAAPSPPAGQGPSNTVRMQGDQVPEIAQAKALAAHLGRPVAFAVRAIGRLVDLITPAEALNYFESCGYDAD